MSDFFREVFAVIAGRESYCRILFHIGLVVNACFWINDAIPHHIQPHSVEIRFFELLGFTYTTREVCACVWYVCVCDVCVVRVCMRRVCGACVYAMCVCNKRASMCVHMQNKTKYIPPIVCTSFSYRLYSSPIPWNSTYQYVRHGLSW